MTPSDQKETPLKACDITEALQRTKAILNIKECQGLFSAGYIALIERAIMKNDARDNQSPQITKDTAMQKVIGWLETIVNLPESMNFCGNFSEEYKSGSRDGMRASATAAEQCLKILKGNGGEG